MIMYMPKSCQNCIFVKESRTEKVPFCSLIGFVIPFSKDNAGIEKLKSWCQL